MKRDPWEAVCQAWMKYHFLLVTGDALIPEAVWYANYLTSRASATELASSSSRHHRRHSSHLLLLTNPVDEVHEGDLSAGDETRG